MKNIMEKKKERKTKSGRKENERIKDIIQRKTVEKVRKMMKTYNAKEKGIQKLGEEKEMKE